MIDNNSIAKAQEELFLDAMRNDLYSYAMGMNTGFIPNDFAEGVAREIQDVMEAKNDRLILIGPPRHGKSLMTSEYAPAWFMGKYPRKKIIGASHTATLAADFGGKVRDHLSDPLHAQVFGKGGALNPKKAASDNFRTNMGGEYFAVGVGGTPIGKGADVYIIDDPIRNRKDVESPQQREDLKSWYSSSVLTRLEGQGGIILMHQRWHEDDLAGYLLREHADDGWRVVHFPAIIENEEDMMLDYLERPMGAALVPELHSHKKLLRLKQTMLPRDWLSMYQGQPRGSEGDEFSEDMLLRFPEEPFTVRQGLNVYILVDPADSQKDSADYTAMAVIGLGPDGNFYLLDMVRERLDLAGRAQTLIDLHRKWRPLAVGYESYGASADIQHITYVQGQQNYRFPIQKVGNQHRLKKEERIRRLIPDFSNGRWYFPDDLKKVNQEGKVYFPLEEMLEEEMIPFPVGRHDDALDSLSRIYDMTLIWPTMNMGTNHTQTGPNPSPW